MSVVLSFFFVRVSTSLFTSFNMSVFVLCLHLLKLANSDTIHFLVFLLVALFLRLLLITECPANSKHLLVSHFAGKFNFKSDEQVTVDEVFLVKGHTKAVCRHLLIVIND